LQVETLPDYPTVELAPRTASRSANDRLVISAAALLSLLLLALGYAAGIQALRLAGVWGALLAGVGAAPLQLSARQTMVERIGVAITIGLSAAIVGGSLMAMTGFWHPFVAAALIGAVATAAHVVGVRRALPELGPGGLARWLSVTAPRVGRLRAAPASLWCTIAGTVLWLASALALGHVNPGLWGFLSHISWLWYVGLLLLVAAIVLAGRLREGFVASAVISLGAALTITPALAYGLPRSQSAVKHVALVETIMHTHHIGIGASIFYAYSGFFCGMAWLCRVAGVTDPTGLATAWPWLIGLLGIGELRFLFGRLVRSPYRCWIGVTLAMLANAVGQDYFSPQSTGYVIVLGVCAIAITGTTEEVLPERMKIAVLVLAGCALAVAHELSPYVAAGVLIVLGVFRITRPRWIALTMLVPAGLWALLNRNVLAGFFNIDAIGNLSNFAPPHTAGSTGLTRAAAVGDSSHALLLGLVILIVLALIGFVRYRRRPGSWALILSAGVGIVFIAINPYGDEGIFRAALFGIPWLVLLALASVRKPRWRRIAVAPLCCVMLACFLVAEFGLDQTNVVRRGDVTSLDAFVSRAPPDSTRLEVGGEGDLPTTLNPKLNNLQWDALWNPLNARQNLLHATVRPTPADLGALTQAYLAYSAKYNHSLPKNLFVVWSKTAAQYSVDYGVETMANSREWLNLFLASPRWRLVYRGPTAYLFRYVPA
jgi:hypothetical protein